RLSRYFLPILKENPAEAQVISHNLMLRAGMIRQVTSGIYNWLPLGLTVLQNISNIIREEMNNIHANEILMPAIQPAELWQESGRYDDYGKEMLRFSDRHNRQMLFGPTHEEVVTDLFRKNINSYKDLPMNLYQIQWKFRDEIRPRFGVMRCREFLMKDSYSFDIDEKSSLLSYDKMFSAYLKIFQRLGLNAIAVKADNGAIGGSKSHEFHILAENGESNIYYDSRLNKLLMQDDVDVENLYNFYAAADDMHKPDQCPIDAEQLSVKKGIEVGHIFNFATKYSAIMNSNINDQSGGNIPVHMGSYGIGVSRLVAAIIEAHHDDKGIIWPSSIAPFDVAIINLNVKNSECNIFADSLYNRLKDAGKKVLYDDVDNSAGKKFAIHDLIGMPWSIVIGPKGLKKNIVELKNRQDNSRIELSKSEAINKILS
ncbi:MAG: proline--tRNA ligase, partial [Pseudomonadota bacterium]